MPNFVYKAKDKSGNIFEGNIVAESQKIVVDKLNEMGYFPVLIQEEQKAEGKGQRAEDREQRELWRFNPINNKEVTMFTRQISDLLEGGLPLNKALSILYQQTQNKQFKIIIEEVNKNVQQGMKFSDALNKYPKIFPAFLVAMIKVGEAGGMLPQVLDRAGDYLERIEDLRMKVSTALIYPCLLVAVGIISICFLMTFVIPKLVTMFEDLGQNLPFPTLILIFSSNFMAKYWWMIFASFIIVIFAIKRMLATQKGRLTIHKFLLSLPYLGEVIKKVEVLKFSLNLGTLLKNGVPILEAIKIISSQSGNLIFKEDIDRIYKQVNEGKGFANSLIDKEFFSSLMVSMVSISEEGGFLEKALLKIASNYEKELDRSIKVITSLLEPIVILAMGFMVGFIVIAMLLPIFKMNILVE
ncbi:MAG: type II secretion system F family protein [bacterium]